VPAFRFKYYYVLVSIPAIFLCFSPDVSILWQFYTARKLTRTSAKNGWYGDQIEKLLGTETEVDTDIETRRY